MGSIKKLLTLAALAAMLVSCRDSLGIDDNYIKIPLDKPDTDNSYLLDNPDFEFSEVINNTTTEDPQSLKLDNYLLNSGSFKADTSGKTPVMWIEMDVGYVVDTLVNPERKARILDFKLKLDSAEIGKDYVLNGNLDGSSWIKITLQDEITGEVSRLTGTDLLAELEFVKYDPIENVIICQLTIKMPGVIGNNQVLFRGLFKFKLKSATMLNSLSVKPKKK